MSAGGVSTAGPSDDSENAAGASAAPRQLSQHEIAFSINKADPFIRWPAHWMEISGPRVAVFFILLGFIDLVVIAPLVGDYDVGLRKDWVGLSVGLQQNGTVSVIERSGWFWLIPEGVIR